MIAEKHKYISNVMIKSISIFIVIMMSFSTVPLFAAGQSPSLLVGSDSAFKGGKAGIKISLEQPTNVSGIQFSIKYDKSVLRVSEEDITNGAAMNGWLVDKNVFKDTGEIKFACASSSGLQVTNPVEICSINFTILAEAQYGETPIVIDSITIGNAWAQKMQYFSSNGKVTILRNSGSSSTNAPLPTKAPVSSPLPTKAPASSPLPKQTSSPSTVPVITTEATASTDAVTGNANASVTMTQINDILDKVNETQNTSAASVEIKVIADPAANQVDITVPKDAFNAVAESKANEVTISTGIADVSFDKTAMAGINSNGTGDISISVAKVDTATLPAQVQTAIGNHPVFNFAVKSGGTNISSFNGGNVTIAVPYQPTPKEDANAVVVYFISSDGKLNVVSLSNANTGDGKINFVTSHFSTYSIGYNKISFTDTQNNWSRDNITYLAARCIAVGTEKGRFDPDKSITRAEFTKMLASILGSDVNFYTSSRFSDVAASTWYAPYIEWAAANGIVTGSDGKFSPDALITREQMATILLRFANKSKYTLTASIKASDFADSSRISSWAASSVRAAQTAGIISGKPGNIFDPQAGATRAEAAKILTILMKGITQ